MPALAPPLRGQLVVESPYGPRPPGAFHTGTDYRARIGTPVYAAAAGRARRATNAGGGRGVVIDHGDGTATEYWHLNAQAIPLTGQDVLAGTLIGYSGASGVVTGPHLHFEVKVNGATTDPDRALVGGTGNNPSSTWCLRPPTDFSMFGAGQGTWVRANADGTCPTGTAGPFPGDGAGPPGSFLPGESGPALVGAAAERFLGLDAAGLVGLGLNVGVVVMAVLVGLGGVKKVVGG